MTCDPPRDTGMSVERPVIAPIASASRKQTVIVVGVGAYLLFPNAAVLKG
jgi:hypothetical protein